MEYCLRLCIYISVTIVSRSDGKLIEVYQGIFCGPSQIRSSTWRLQGYTSPEIFDATGIQRFEFSYSDPGFGNRLNIFLHLVRAYKHTTHNSVLKMHKSNVSSFSRLEPNDRERVKYIYELTDHKPYLISRDLKIKVSILNWLKTYFTRRLFQQDASLLSGKDLNVICEMLLCTQLDGTLPLEVVEQIKIWSFLQTGLARDTISAINSLDQLLKTAFSKRAVMHILPSKGGLYHNVVIVDPAPATYQMSLVIIKVASRVWDELIAYCKE
jgi:hypothetical protein